MIPRKTIRIFSSQNNGFVIQHDLIAELMKNMKEDDISISAICDYVTLIETDEIYDEFAYNVSTKDVVSSGKTSWSAIGNEKYYEVTGEK